MSLPVVYLPAAENDIAASFANYEAESPGLGQRFTAAVRDTVGDVVLKTYLYGQDGGAE